MTSPNPLLTLPTLESVLKTDPKREIKVYDVAGHTDPFLPPSPVDFILQEEKQYEYFGIYFMYIYVLIYFLFSGLLKLIVFILIRRRGANQID